MSIQGTNSMFRRFFIFLIFLSATTGAIADPLTISVRSLDVDRFKLLMNEHPDLKATDSHGMTALHHACALGAVEMVTILLKEGADIYGTSNDGKNALHHAVSIAPLCFTPQPSEGGLTICPLTVPQMLASAGVNINAFDKNGNTPLHIAASNGLVGVIAALLQAGAKPNIKNKAGSTSLHLVGGMLPHISAQVLLLSGADADIRDGDGFKPIDIAMHKKNALLVNMINKYAKKNK